MYINRIILCTDVYGYIHTGPPPVGSGEYLAGNTIIVDTYFIMEGRAGGGEGGGVLGTQSIYRIKLINIFQFN